MRWPMVPLRKVAPSQASPLRFSGDQSVWHLSLDQIESGTGQIVDKKTSPASDAGTSTYVFDGGNVLYSKLRPYLNKVVSPEEPGIATTELVPLRPIPGVMDRKFLTYYLRSEQFLAFATHAVAGVKMPRIIMEKFWNHQVPLPPPSEQQQIVKILDQADAVRRKRAEAGEKAQRILPALFMRMFGGTESHWSEAPISELVEQRTGSIRTGPFGSQLRHSEFVERGIPVLGIDNVVTNRFRWTNPRALPTEKYNQFKRFRVFPEDVLITIMGTTGRVCVAPTDLPECMSTKHLCVLTFDRRKVEPVYVWAALLFDPFVRAQIESSGHGAIMEGWNTTIVKNLKLRVPSPDLQHEFAQHTRAVLAHETNSEVSASNLKKVFELVTHRAFSGDLTARWRETRAHELLREAKEQARMIEKAASNGSGRTGRGRPRRASSC